MNAGLGKYGFKGTGTSFEKLELRKSEKERRFTGILWLKIAKVAEAK